MNRRQFIGGAFALAHLDFFIKEFLFFLKVTLGFAFANGFVLSF